MSPRKVFWAKVIKIGANLIRFGQKLKSCISDNIEFLTVMDLMLVGVRPLYQ